MIQDLTQTSQSSDESKYRSLGSEKGEKMGHLVDAASVGILLLVIYIINDCIRNKTKNLLRRVIFYSFVVYILYVFQYTTGGFHYPPQQQYFGTVIIQPRPFQFVSDWIHAYQLGGPKWFFWISVRLTLYNAIMLLPLGVYLKVLFNMKEIRKAAVVILLASIFIETYQIVFTYFGLVFPRTFNVDDIILNTVGGVTGYYVSTVVLQRWFPGLLPDKRRESNVE